MPGVVLDEQSFQLDAMPPSSLYDTFSSHISQVDEVQQMFRENSYSGMNDTSTMGLSRSAPVYNRSQSALSSAAALQAFNYFNSPPTTPKKSSEHAFSPMSMLDVGMDDFPNMEGDGHGGLGSPSAVNAMAMAISAGNPVSTDMRNLAFGNSPMVGSPTLADSVSAYKYLPSNNDDEEAWGSVTDVYACDQFRMFEFKVRRCMRGRSHDWTECPFAHPGEKARRRDPRRFHYSGTACPDFRKGSCRRGDACEFAHGVFECWLHPARYRTQPCKDGRNCRRRVCFFAHTPEQLRLLPAAAQAASAAARTNGLNGGGQGAAFSPGALGGSYDGSPGRSGSVSFDGSLGYDGNGGGCVSHCSLASHGSCQSNGSVHGVCGGHYDQAFGGNAGPHSAHCCASPQMSSPTSTLVGHTSSPPPLSPPLSPSGSPPMSPQAHHWANSGGGMLHQNGHSFPSGPPVSNSHSHSQGAYNPTPFQVSQPQGGAGYIQGPCSPLARGANNQAAMSAAVAAAAQAHNNPHRRHLERLNSMPTLSIPPVEHPHRAMLQGVTSPLSSPSSCSPPSPAGVSASNMSEIIATIQQLGLNGNFNGFPPRNNGSVPYWLHSQVQPMQAANNHYSSGPSPLRRCSQSVPCTPTKLKWEENRPRWEVEESEEVEQPVQRVESGRDLRAKIYGKLGKEPCAEGSETPDLDWVSQLITDEQVTTW